jgi:hypothetical protein
MPSARAVYQSAINPQMGWREGMYARGFRNDVGQIRESLAVTPILRPSRLANPIMNSKNLPCLTILLSGPRVLNL